MPTFPNLFLPIPGERLTCSRVPGGMDSFVLSRYLKAFPDKSFVYVVQNETRMVQVQNSLEFIGSQHQILTFPAWDCLPYDRVSPRSEIMSQRMKVLSELTTSLRPNCLITTARAITQRVPPASALSGEHMLTRVGDEIDLEALNQFLVDNGYTRVATVREPGGYAIRGGIIDIYPAGETAPIRLDLFGTMLESVKTFDPVSQRSQQKRSSFSLDVVGELTLSKERIDNFRIGYRQQFGAGAVEDAIYSDVIAGRVHRGMEHWLPLFYESVDTFFDRLQQNDTVVLLEHQIEHSLAHHIGQIEEYYQARKDAQLINNSTSELAYRPLAPKALYLDLPELQNRLSRYPLIEFSPFLSETSQSKSLDFCAERFSLQDDGILEPRHFDNLRDSLLEWRREGTPVLLASYSRSSQKNLLEVLKNHQIDPIQEVENWSDLQQVSNQAIGCTQLNIERGFIAPELVVITEQDLLGQRQVRPQRPETDAKLFIRDLSALKVNDLVVHQEHGVGKYLGLILVEADGIPHDCLGVEYAGGDKLFVPVENIEILSLYGSEDSQAQLDRLGAASWQNRKAKVKKRLEIIADQLLKLASERETRKGERFSDLRAGYAKDLNSEFCGILPVLILNVLDMTLGNQGAIKSIPMDQEPSLDRDLCRLSSVEGDRRCDGGSSL